MYCACGGVHTLYMYAVNRAMYVHVLYMVVLTFIVGGNTLLRINAIRVRCRVVH